MLAVGIAGDAAEEAANVVVDCRWCDNALPGPVPAPLDPRLTKPKPRFRAPIPVGKRHRHHMIRFLPRLLPWVREHLDAGRTVVIVDDDGEDRAPILLVALLSAFWTDDGARLSASGEGARARMEAHIAGLSKATFTQRYQWCVASNTKLFSSCPVSQSSSSLHLHRAAALNPFFLQNQSLTGSPGVGQELTCRAII